MDDEALPALSPHAGEQHGETLLYDYSKFMTTLSLIALGGVLTLSQSDGLATVRPSTVLLVVGSISVGGVASLGTAHSIVSARHAGRAPGKHLRLSMLISLFGLGLGLGSFLNIFLDALK